MSKIILPKGMKVFPVSSQRKEDGSKNAYWIRHMDTATDDPKTYQQWVDNGFLLALPVGEKWGWFGIDVDPAEGGLETIKGFENKYGEMKDTFSVSTPHGGFHPVFRYPSGTYNFHNSSLGDGFGVKISANSYIIVGGEGYEPTSGTVSIQYPPAFLVNKLIEKSIRIQKPHDSNKDYSPEEEVEFAEACLNRLSRDRADSYGDASEGQWLGIGMALHTMKDEEKGLELFHEFSQGSDKYDEVEVDKKWKTFNGDGIGLGSLYHWANEDDPSPISTPSMSKKEVEKLNEELDSVMEDIDDGGNPNLDSVLSDIGNANRMIALHGDDFRWCSLERIWYVWNGKKWDENGETTLIKFTEDVAIQLLKEAQEAKDADERARLTKHALISQGAHAAQNMMYRARKHSIDVDEFDKDNHLLNCNNGVLNLDTGELTPHKEAKRFKMRKIANVDYIPGADCPKFKEAMEFAHEGDKETVLFIQKARGLSISGCVDKIIPFEHGVPNSGKSTISELMLWMLGKDYADKTNLKGFVKASRDDGGDKPNSYIASLRGKRFVVANENKGFKWDTALMKDISGMDTLTDRQPHGQKITFPATHILWIYGNTYPDISDDIDDDAFFNRLCDVPYNKAIQNMRSSDVVQAEYHAEASGILNWLVDGFQMWRKEGIQKSSRIEDATNKLRHSQDLLVTFFDDTYEVTNNPSDLVFKITFANEYNDYREQCGQRPETPMGIGKKMAKMAETKKFESGGQGKTSWKFLKSKL